MTSRVPWLLGVGFVLAFAIRALPGLDGAADYDEGVYLGGAWALVHGQFPYRDFVFVHPPGILLAFAPLVALGLTKGLWLARLLAALVGATNTVLVARLLKGWPAVVAWLFLATWFECVSTERGAFLEPLMTCAGLVGVTLAHRNSRRAVVAAGIVLSLAMLIKLWGAMWLLVALFVVERRHLVTLLGTAVLGFAVFLAPFALSSPSELVLQVLVAHVFRPPDGDLDRLVRLREMFTARSWDATLVLLVGLPFALRGAQRRLAFGVTLATAALVGAFLLSAAWWNQYDAALAPLLVLLLGLGLEGLQRFPRVGLVAVVLAGAMAVRHVRGVTSPPPSSAEQLERAKTLVPGTCAFEVFELVQAGLDVPQVRPMLIDSYGQALVDAARVRARFPSANALFQDEVSQTTYRLQLEQCEHVSLGWRGNWQLNERSKALARQRFGELR